ncbi:MAG: hypothetical protein ACK5CA_15415 [Cyanobacteriota bacterium]|jgi:hypothetical protein
MPYKKVTIYLTVQELCKKLQITSQTFYDIETKIKSDTSGNWQLKEGKHYKVVVKKTGLREYTEIGAYIIVDYFQTEYYKDKGIIVRIIENIKEWIKGLKRDIKQYCVRQRVTYSSASLVRRQDKFWLSRLEVARIFETRPDYLDKIHESLTKSDVIGNSPTLILLRDDDFYEDIDFKKRYYSLQGINKLAQQLSKSLSLNSRKSWCNDVGEIIEDQIAKIKLQVEKREKDIEKAKKSARDRDEKRCLVTGEKQVPAADFKLAVHHLYSQNEYPHLADNPINMITIKQTIHDQFHDHYMGGKNKPCKLEDFSDFLHLYYPQSTELIIYLQKCNLGLGEPLPLKKLSIEVPRVLYLPSSRFTQNVDHFP